MYRLLTAGLLLSITLCQLPSEAQNFANQLKKLKQAADRAGSSGSSWTQGGTSKNQPNRQTRQNNGMPTTQPGTINIETNAGGAQSGSNQYKPIDFYGGNTVRPGWPQSSPPAQSGVVGIQQNGYNLNGQPGKVNIDLSGTPVAAPPNSGYKPIDFNPGGQQLMRFPPQSQPQGPSAGSLNIGQPSGYNLSGKRPMRRLSEFGIRPTSSGTDGEQLGRTAR